jgi:hypothetical protein
MKKIILTLAIMSTIVLSGCSTRVADFTVVSTKNMNLNSGELVSGDRVEGSDGVPVVLFPLGRPNIKEATDHAIENDRCVVGLTDVVLDQFAFAFIIGYISFDIEGTQVVDKSLPGCENWSPKATL